MFEWLVIDWNDLIKTMIFAMFIGFGSAIGAYFSNKAFIKNYEKLLKSVKRKVRRHVQAKKHKM